MVRAAQVRNSAAAVENAPTGGTVCGRVLPSLTLQSCCHSDLASQVTDVPCWGPKRGDTIYDAIMDHYNSQRAPGAFTAAFIRDPDGPIARLLRSCRTHQSVTKVAMFTFFTGTNKDGVVWTSDTWHFFLHLLYCLRVLMAGASRVGVRVATSYPGDRCSHVPAESPTHMHV